MEFFDFSGNKPIARGQMRNVYQHPTDAGLLVKTIKPERVDERGRLRALRWYKFNSRYGAYEVLRREALEFITQCRRSRHRRLDEHPFAAMIGFVDTNEGLGLVVEKIVDEEGGLAKNLHELIRKGRHRPEHREALMRFFDRCRDDHVVLCDTTPGNLVFTTARHGTPEVVCIDGLGERTLIPVHVWSKTLNSRRIERVRARHIAQLDRLIAGMKSREAETARAEAA